MKTFKIIPVITLLILMNSLLFAQNVIKQRLDSTVNIANGDKYEYFYDNFGFNTSAINYSWSNTIMKYEKSSKRDFKYNLNGYCIFIQTSIWDKVLNQWVVRDKVDQTYDDNNQLLLTNSFEWNMTENKWDFISKSDYENVYNANNKPNSTVIYTNRKNAPEVLKAKFEYIFNSNGRITSIKYYRWVSYAWKQENIENYTYDVDGNISSIGDFQVKYNNNFSINQLLIPIDYFPHWTIIPTDFNVDHMITNWVHTSGGTKRYYYSPMEVTGINDLETLKTTLFPNPATDFLNIQWNGNQSILNVELIDIKGKKVFNGMVENNYKLPIQAYPKGLYMVRILDGNKTVETEKVYFK